MDAVDGLAPARARLLAAGSVCVLTGSGISVESGLPTFRGAGGLWRTHRVEELASPEGFAHDPRLVWTWYDERRAVHDRAKPNAGHLALAKLERRVADFTLATQNVDSLHLRAGSQNVLELHGHLREARCDRCGARRPLEGPFPLDEIEHACGGRFRPDIVWFGEGLPAALWSAAIEAVARADVVIAVGTSGVVQPAASLFTHLVGSQTFTIEVNPETSALSPHADIVLYGTAASVLPRLVETERGKDG